MTTTTLDRSLLVAALEGLEHRRQLIDGQIAEIRSQLGSSPKTASSPVAVSASESKARRLSPAGRKRIADAARKRWAALRQQRAKEAAAKIAKTAPKTKRAASKPAKKVAKRKKAAQAPPIAAAAEAGGQP